MSTETSEPKATVLTLLERWGRREPGTYMGAPLNLDAPIARHGRARFACSVIDWAGEGGIVWSLQHSEDGDVWLPVPAVGEWELTPEPDREKADVHYDAMVDLDAIDTWIRARVILATPQDCTAVLVVATQRAER